MSQSNDDFDIKVVARFAKRSTGRAFALGVVFSLVFWSWKVVVGFSSPPMQSVTARMNFIFEGALEGKYPNKEAFALSHVIAPVVLDRVFEANRLGRYLDREEFLGSFSILPYNPEREFILRKYRDLLDRPNLSFVDIEELQGRLGTELISSEAVSAELIFTSSALGAFPRLELEGIIRKIPEQWAIYAIKQLGVLKPNELFYTPEIVDVELIESSDYLISFEILLDRLNLLQENIEVLSDYPNGGKLQDPETGFFLGDLKKSISDEIRYKVIPLQNPVRSLGLAKDMNLVSLYFENELISLNREESLLAQTRKNIEEASDAYSNAFSSGRPADGVTGGQGSSTVLNDGFLEQIIDLVNASNDSSFRQDLNERFLEASNALGEVKIERERLQQILASMKGVDDEQVLSSELRQRYVERVEFQLPKIVERVVELFHITERMYEAGNAQMLGDTGLLYRFSDGEFEFDVANGILTGSNTKLYFALMFLVVLLSIPMIMLVDYVREERD